MAFATEKSKVATKIRPSLSAAMPSGEPGPGLGRVAKRTTPSESAATPVENAATSGNSNASRRFDMSSSQKKCCPMESTELDAKKSTWRRVQALETCFRDANQLAHLHSRLVVARDHVRLHDNCHVLFERHLR